MKFSKKRKAKMKKYRNKRIKRSFNAVCSSVSYCGWEWNDEDERWKAVDCASFRHTCYILAKSVTSEKFAIFKLVSECIAESVKLSSKKLLENRRTFNSPSVWVEKSDVVIDEKGCLEKVDVGAHKKPFGFGGAYVIIVPTF